MRHETIWETERHHKKQDQTGPVGELATRTNGFVDEKRAAERR